MSSHRYRRVDPPRRTTAAAARRPPSRGRPARPRPAINPARPRRSNRRAASSSPSSPPSSTTRAAARSRLRRLGGSARTARSPAAPQRLLDRAPVKPHPQRRLQLLGQLGPRRARPLPVARLQERQHLRRELHRAAPPRPLVEQPDHPRALERRRTSRTTRASTRAPRRRRRRSPRRPRARAASRTSPAPCRTTAKNSGCERNGRPATASGAGCNSPACSRAR